MPLNLDTQPPYFPGTDDLGDAPYGEDMPLPADPTVTPLDPLVSEQVFRRALLTVLTEIRDLLAESGEG